MRNVLYILTILMFVAISNVNAQQQPQYTQFQHNPYVINNAFAGVYDMLDINASFRRQWVGINGAPETYYLSVSSPIGKNKKPLYNPSLRISRPGAKSAVSDPQISTGKVKHGVGGIILNDKYGHFVTTNVLASYAIHVPIIDGYNFALGVQGGVSNHILRDLNLLDIGDPYYATIMANGGKKNYFDLNSSALFYSEDLFIGYTVNNLIKYGINNRSNPSDYDLRMHHFAMAGCNFYLSNDRIKLTPSVIAKYMNPVPVVFDVNVKAVFDNWIWGGLSYRHTDAISAMFGLYVNGMFKLSYSYDFSVAGLRSYNAGSHEVVMGFTLGNQK